MVVVQQKKRDMEKTRVRGENEDLQPAPCWQSATMKENDKFTIWKEHFAKYFFIHYCRTFFWTVSNLY